VVGIVRRKRQECLSESDYEQATGWHGMAYQQVVVLPVVSVCVLFAILFRAAV
jgi:hypothetical protein